MSEPYEVKLAEFNGPLYKLLELIEEKKLEITRLNLGEVTADFLAYLENLKDVDSRLLADFITVAAKLILIKSHALLPQMQFTEEEEKEIADLEIRLKLYREFKAAEGNIELLWFKKVAYSRDFLAGVPQGFYLSQPLKGDDLKKKMEKIIEELALVFPKTESSEVKLMNLEEKIEELISRVDKVVRTSFNELTKGKERSEVVVLFLALLYLLKDNLIKTKQDDKFSDIEVLSVKNGK